MKNDDLTFGSHSGIQKAVRRGDLDLAKTSIEALWSEKQHRSWLRWRALSIVQEDCLPMIGAMPALYEMLKKVDKESTEELILWRKFLYRCTVCPATKDAAGLINLAREADYTSDHPEWVDARPFAMRLEKEAVDAVTDDMAEWAKEQRKLSKYELAAIDLLRRRAAMGGMAGDRVVPIAAISIIVHRGLNPKELEARVRAGAKAWEKEMGRSKPVTVELPWYCFDMHTQVGKIAMSAVARREKIEKDVLFRLWFYCESAKHPRWHVEWTDIIKSPSMFQTMWWKEWTKVVLAKTGMPARDAMLLWRNKMSEKVQGMVEYLLRKRASE